MYLEDYYERNTIVFLSYNFHVDMTLCTRVSYCEAAVCNYQLQSEPLVCICSVHDNVIVYMLTINVFFK